MCMCVCQSLNGVWLFATLWMLARQAPLSLWFPRQEYWSGLPFSSRGSSWPRDRTQASCISCTAGEFFTAELLGKPFIGYN